MTTEPSAADLETPSLGASPGPLVVSLLAKTLKDFRKALALGAASSADVVELRLDHVADEILAGSDTDWEAALRHLFALAGRPTIVALHGGEGFGTFQGTAAQRAEVLNLAARAGADLIDIDASILGQVRLDDTDARRILSTHRELARIDAESLDAVAAELHALCREPSGLDRKRDLIKIVPHASRAEDALVLLDWLAAQPDGSTIAFASGSPAAYSRLAAPAFGSVFVYAAPARIDEPDSAAPLLSSAAPGQLRVPHVRAVWGAEVEPAGEGTAVPRPPLGGSYRCPGRQTLLAAVCGRPIGHSASPVAHAAAFRVLGLDALFLPVAPTSFEGFCEAVRDSPRWVGLSVTAPFKLDALALAAGDEGAGMGDAAAAIGAANTLRFVPARPGPAQAAVAQRYRASNTDSPAVGAALAEGLGGPEPGPEAEPGDLHGKQAVVIGAGGAARAAVFALLHAGAQVTVAARRVEAAAELASELAAAVELSGAAYRALRPDIIVHTTPLGTDGIGAPDVPDAHLRPGVIVLDAVYRPRETELLRRAREAGAAAVSGERWFLMQAWLQHAALFERHYPQSIHGSVPLGPEAERKAQAAMGEALSRWLSGITSSEG